MGLIMNSVQIKNGNVYYDGKEVKIFCRYSPKFLAYLVHGKRDKMLAWIGWNQKLGFNTLEVLGELHQPPLILDKPPGLKGIWAIQQMLNGNRVEELNEKNKKLLFELYQISHLTGMAFIYTINCTLKDIVGMYSGMIGHTISRTLEFCRTVAEGHPKAKIIFNFHNGWNTAWNANMPDAARVKLGLWELGQQAGRTRRWFKTWVLNKDVIKETKMAFKSPGSEWKPEQYPEAAIMTEEGHGTVTYPTGKDVKEYPITAIRPQSLRTFGMGNLHRPVYLSKTPPVTEDNYYDYISYMDTMRRRGFHFCVCDAKGQETDSSSETTKFEQYLIGDVPPPPPPPPPKESLLQRVFRILEELLFGKKE